MWEQIPPSAITHILKPRVRKDDSDGRSIQAGTKWKDWRPTNNPISEGFSDSFICPPSR